MKTKHTPGPWRGHPKARGNVEDLNGRGVANCMGYQTNTDNGEHHDENLANAQLIATAPEMLDVLSDALETMNILFGVLPKEMVCLRYEISSRKLQIESIIQKATS